MRAVRRRWWLVTLIAALVLLAVGGFRYVTSPPRGLVGAIHLLEDQSHFDTTSASGETLARVADLLVLDARNCHRRTPSATGCTARYSAAAWSEVAALKVLDCSRPAAYKVRVDLLGHLRRVSEMAANDRAPKLPLLPAC